MVYIYIKIDKYFYDLFQNTDRRKYRICSKLIIYASRFPSGINFCEECKGTELLLFKSPKTICWNLFLLIWDAVLLRVKFANQIFLINNALFRL